MFCFISNKFNKQNCPDLLPIFLLYSFAVDRSIKWTESQNILALKRFIKSIILLYSFAVDRFINKWTELQNSLALKRFIESISVSPMFIRKIRMVLHFHTETTHSPCSPKNNKSPPKTSEVGHKFLSVLQTTAQSLRNTDHCCN